MINRILLVVTFSLLVVYLVIDDNSSSKSTTIFLQKENYINVKDSKTNNIEEMDLEDYIVGVVAAEMPASFNEEALKAQAIASRSYAVYKMKHNMNNYDVVTDVSNQAYITIEEMKKKWGDDFQKYYDKIVESVNETKGIVMKYNDEVIKAFFFAMSNGYTEDSTTVFNEKLDYIKSVKVEYDNENIKNYEVIKSYNKNDFCNKLNINCSNIKINNINKSDTGHVLNIEINNKKFTGIEFRKLLGLRSSDFTININNDKVSITTKGYGHGVGMSQYGANGMANDGYTYAEILNYYYQNIEITTI